MYLKIKQRTLNLIFSTFELSFTAVFNHVFAPREKNEGWLYLPFHMGILFAIFETLRFP